MSWWRKEPQPQTQPAPEDPNLPVIRLQHVSKIFPGEAGEQTRALDDVSVDIRRGEYVAVGGPSGWELPDYSNEGRSVWRVGVRFFGHPGFQV